MTVRPLQWAWRFSRNEVSGKAGAVQLRLLPLLCGGHRQLALENLALRQQLVVYTRTAIRPRLRTTDRLFWVWLARVWAGWKQPLVLVTPDTVLRWQRRRFREHWTTLSSRPRVGRPPISAEIKTLVTRMAAANPLWGAPRILGELLKVGITVAERTVSRLMPKRRTPPSQTWRTFPTLRSTSFRAGPVPGKGRRVWLCDNRPPGPPAARVCHKRANGRQETPDALLAKDTMSVTQREFDRSRPSGHGNGGRLEIWRP